MCKEKINMERMHPICLLIYLAGAMAFTMISADPLLLTVSLLSSSVIMRMVCGKHMGKSVICFGIPLLFFSAGILPLFSHNGVTHLFYLNGQPVTWESVWYGIVMSEMFVSIFIWFCIGSRLLDGEKILYLFGKIVPSFGLLLSMIFRMIPLFRSRFREIREAQKGLGMHGRQEGIIGRCRMLGKECSILVSWSLEKSVETSLSMESRGYGTGRRTSFHLFRIHRSDVVSIVLLLILFGVTACGIGKGNFQTTYFPLFSMTGFGTDKMVAVFAFVAAVFLPIGCEGVKK